VINTKFSQPSTRTFDLPTSLSGDFNPLRVEPATLWVAFFVYAGYGATTWFFRDMPLWAFATLSATLITWQGSLQHETIHRHPTTSRRLNRWLACVPLSLWVPYRIYYATHLQHHRYSGRHLTDVDYDPESFYVRPGSLPQYGCLRRAIYAANCTLAGRLLLGPALSVSLFWVTETRKMFRGDARRALIWARHTLAVGCLLLWVHSICGIPLGVYLLLSVYPSIALTLLRSFVEHRADSTPSRRTVAVEASLFWSLLFLNNNLHIAHHAHPSVPWYRLPGVWRRMRGDAAGRGLVFSGGYVEVARRYLWQPAKTIEHPGEDAQGLDGMLPVKT
jgi:fatty acid desaturase